MTDLVKLKALLTDFGVGFNEGETSIHSEDKGVWITTHGVTMEAEENAKVSGYFGFVCTFHFDDQGKFIQVSVLE